jgi:hypothetical protein
METSVSPEGTLSVTVTIPLVEVAADGLAMVTE